ncbi:MAG: hypothetical protein PHS80_06270 [Methanothrix sp.]|nr:hypothetical protein [Methanothrix sp.]MDD4446790.1 hypothetical protein [Methanothrix sp.]
MSRRKEISFDLDRLVRATVDLCISGLMILGFLQGANSPGRAERGWSADTG